MQNAKAVRRIFPWPLIYFVLSLIFLFSDILNMNLKRVHKNSNIYEKRRKNMTREEHFEDIKVVKENHLCEMTIMEENLMLCIDSMLKENKEA